MIHQNYYHSINLGALYEIESYHYEYKLFKKTRAEIYSTLESTLRSKGEEEKIEEYRLIVKSRKINSWMNVAILKC